MKCIKNKECGNKMVAKTKGKGVKHGKAKKRKGKKE
jgi:hypothetical protein